MEDAVLSSATFTIQVEDASVTDAPADLESRIDSLIDGNGKSVYTGKQTSSGGGFKPYTAQVTISDLNIRKGPGTNYAKTGQYTGKGVFTIVAESGGKGSTKGWGKLKSVSK